MRDVAWGFFYGGVNFDHVIGTDQPLQDRSTSTPARYNAHDEGRGRRPTRELPDRSRSRATFKQMLDDWTNEGFDPFAAPQETGSPYGRKHGNNTAKITPARELATRCVGLKDDLALRTDARGAPVNRAFADVPQDEPELHPEPGLRERGARASTCSPSCRARRSPGTRASPRS